MRPKNKPTLEQLCRRARHVLRREGLVAGKRYGVKMNFTVPSEDLRTAALWWERARFRATERTRLIKELGKYGYQLYRHKVRTAREAEREQT